MQLPFTTDQFFDVFAAYNDVLWPGAVALWIASASAAVLLVSGRRSHDRWISGLLAVHWAWSAVAYHMAFFSRINPAAWIFAAVFLVQSALFIWTGVMQNRLSFAAWRNGWAAVGWVFVAFSLIYPALNAVDHHSVWRIPTFGVPCPTTILTVGLLLLASPRSRRLMAIPVIWSAIGGAAAALLGVHTDYALPIAGVALVMFTTQRRMTSVIC